MLQSQGGGPVPWNVRPTISYVPSADSSSRAEKKWDVIDLSISYGSRDINFKIWAQIFANLETPVDQGDIPGSTGVKVYTRRTTPGLSISFTLTIQKFALAQRCCCVATDRDRQKCLSRSQPTGPGGWIGLYVQTRG